MKNLSVFLMLLGSFAYQPVFSENIVDIKQAKNNKALSLKINGASSSRQKAFMKITNKTNQLIKLIISAGDMLITPSTSTQNLIITKSEEIQIQPHQSISKNLFALCAEKYDGSPSDETQYSPNRKATGNLLAMAEYIDKNNLYDEGVAQHAIWAITDNAELSQVEHSNKTIERDLQTMIAKHQNLDLEKELVKIKAQKLMSSSFSNRRRITSFHGNISFNLEKDAKVNLVLVDPKGKTVATFLNEENLSAGIHKKDFAYTDANIQYGLYQLIVVADGKEKLRRRVQLK
jgi:hypothetical protein